MKARLTGAITMEIVAPLKILEIGLGHVEVEFEGERVVLSEGDTLQVNAHASRDFSNS